MGIRNRQLLWWRARRMRTRPLTSTRSRGVPSAATASAAVSEAASVAASRAAAVRAPELEPAAGRAGGKALTPNEAAVAAAGICWNHWWFAERASHCKGSAVSPCSWQGN
jgi:hypothetical protein